MATDAYVTMFRWTPHWSIVFMEDYFEGRTDDAGWPTRDSAAPQEDC